MRGIFRFFHTFPLIKGGSGGFQLITSLRPLWLDFDNFEVRFYLSNFTAARVKILAAWTSFVISTCSFG